ncbi:tetraacyldisaccharide 4'-kinase [Joostella sp.]|uniref:tetraacyldisaccharide 4'-kinase n=1 Tax=Joostella sp. TaxID=2231138 RepID=UPI003A8D915E
MRRWRKLLLPFSWIYGAIIFVRNYLFDIQFFKSAEYQFPVICIGNLSVGGTGKTPMTEYVSQLLKDTFKTAILSRGYKRATKGFVLAADKATVEGIGDEPFQYHNKLKGVTVAVDEDRQHGIFSLREAINPEVIILDDAFQHRKVKAGLNILLTMYGDLYPDDLLLPAGNLRDLKGQAKRAEIIVVTKCPSDLSKNRQTEIINKLKVAASQKVFFATISYKEKVLSNKESIFLEELKNKNVTLVTGIANPEPLLIHLKEQGISFDHHKFPDHHNFSTSEIEMFKAKDFILTTEKDFVRLEKYLSNVYYLPIETKFVNDEEGFDASILAFAGK